MSGPAPGGRADRDPLELTFPSGGPYPLKLTTEVRVLPDTRPYTLGKD